ncbi:vWA domain-containing protein [Paenibacillus crassostreae]|uniref:VWFA domain-containing protein n=1 Tax=Paenibacillus crassostreae TaxID=1763538 RepID=A0A167GK13_9BACL|nr:BatA and WFA domain-containing protein [Paenibacillus crassostreae]AOZ92184.1 hypothetical protein LPB68_08050 [Paenibacillus crassostreae]OAB77644.1 hypothetical protein PNBC_01130 [Paenibacillus crassostreae]
MGIGSWLGMVFGLSIPAILLMYLLKRKFIDTLVPSHLLWERVLRNIEANRPWQKLQNRLLLWLQLIVAALLVFALMQPYGWVSDNVKSHVVIVADTSGSMSANTDDLDAEGENSNSELKRIDLLKSQAKDYLKDHAKSSEITLLSMDSEPKIVISREKNHKEVEEALNNLQPYYGKAAYQETLSLASALTTDEQDAEIIVFTDTQWKGDTEGISFQVPSVVVDIGASPLNNIGIKQFGVQSNSTGTIAVAVLESMTDIADPIEYSLYGDEQLLVTQNTEFQDGTATIRIDNLQDAEVYRLEILSKDAYQADNISFAFGSNNTTSKVLLLSSGNFFLEKALQLTGVEVTKMVINDSVTEEGIKSEVGLAVSSPPVPGDKPDLIVIEGVIPPFITQGDWEKLLSDTPLWHIGGAGKEVNVGGEKAILHDHAVTQYLSLSNIYVGVILETDVPEWGDPIVEIGGKAAIYAGKESGHSRLSFLFKLEDSDLPLSAEFPILVNNAVSWLSNEEGYGLGRVIAGASLDIPISVEVTKAIWIAKGGLALASGIEPIAADQGTRGYNTIQKTPAIPGLYAFEQQDREGNKTSYWVDVTADPFESDIGEKTALSFTQQISETTGDMEQNDVRNAKVEEGKVPMSLMWIVAAVALVIILLEWGVYQRGRSI